MLTVVNLFSKSLWDTILIKCDLLGEFQCYKSHFAYVLEAAYWTAVLLLLPAFIVILLSDPEELHTQR